MFCAVRHSVPPPKDEEEARRHDEGILRAFNGILLRAFTYLDEYHPAVARALEIGGRDCAEAWLRGEEAEFIVSMKAAKELPDFMLYPSLLATHGYVLRRLRENWRKPGSRSRHHQKSRFVSKKGRYGEAQRAVSPSKAEVSSASGVSSSPDSIEYSRWIVLMTILAESPTVAEVRRWMLYSSSSFRLSSGVR